MVCTVLFVSIMCQYSCKQRATWLSSLADSRYPSHKQKKTKNKNSWSMEVSVAKRKSVGGLSMQPGNKPHQNKKATWMVYSQLVTWLCLCIWKLRQHSCMYVLATQDISRQTIYHHGEFLIPLNGQSLFTLTPNVYVCLLHFSMKCCCEKQCSQNASWSELC